MYVLHNVIIKKPISLLVGAETDRGFKISALFSDAGNQNGERRGEFADRLQFLRVSGSDNKPEIFLCVPLHGGLHDSFQVRRQGLPAAAGPVLV